MVEKCRSDVVPRRRLRLRMEGNRMDRVIVDGATTTRHQCIQWPFGISAMLLNACLGLGAAPRVYISVYIFITNPRKPSADKFCIAHGDILFCR